MKCTIANWAVLILFGVATNSTVAAEVFRFGIETSKVGQLPAGWSKRLDLRGTTFQEAGEVGLWMQADAQTRFACLGVSSTGIAERSSIGIKILYDNYVFDKACGPDWGFACLVTGLEKTILFDTGGKGDLLLSNFEKMKVRPSDVELVVISHNHNDHTGGLLSFLAKNKNVTVFLPAATPDSLVKEVEACAASMSVVTKPREICKGAVLLGPVGDQIVEQALVLDTKRGLVIITGCSHPGIAAITARAKQLAGRDVFMVLGGTHLLRHSDTDLQQVIHELKELGVQKVGATHCSGDNAIAKLKAEFGDGFIPMGVGRAIDLASD